MNDRGTAHKGPDRCLYWHGTCRYPRSGEWCSILIRDSLSGALRISHTPWTRTDGFLAASGNLSGSEAVIGWMPDPEPPEREDDIPEFWERAPAMPDRQRWCHVLHIGEDGRVRIRNDLYAVETAEAHGDAPGFCLDRVHGKRGEGRYVDAWLPWPGVPDQEIATALLDEAAP